MTRPRAVLVSGAALLLLALPLPAASAHRASPTPRVVSDQMLAPFNLDVSSRSVLVADGGAEVVGALARDGSLTPLATEQPGTSGVARSRDGRRVAWTTTVTDYSTFTNTASGLTVRGPGGRTVHSDTLAYETAHNPDAGVHYGVTDPTPSTCVTDALTAAGIPVAYTGGVDSHAYSVASYRDGWVVADAGANDLLWVDARGRVHTLAVLPAQPTTMTAAMVSALGLPECVTGVTYNFEAVPTDVEVGHDGALYVSVLPGGPESPVLGARGAVYRVDPRTGASHEVARGFLGATNLALGHDGEIYVAELFGGKVSVVRHGRISTYVELPGVVAVETGRGGELWAGTMANEDPAAPGTIVRITRGHEHGRLPVHD